MTSPRLTLSEVANKKTVSPDAAESLREFRANIAVQQAIYARRLKSYCDRDCGATIENVRAAQKAHARILSREPLSFSKLFALKFQANWIVLRVRICMIEAALGGRVSPDFLCRSMNDAAAFTRSAGILSITD